MARPRFAGLIPSTGVSPAFPSALYTFPNLMDYNPDPTLSSPYIGEATDEVITLADSDDLIFKLDLIPAGDPMGVQSDDSATLEIWSGAGKTGTQFDLIRAGTAFGVASAREARVYPGLARVDFDAAQIADLGAATLYASYFYSHTWPDNALLAEVIAELIAVQKFAWGYGEAQALEALTVGWGYFDAYEYKLRQLTSLQEQSHLTAAVWILEACSAFATAKYVTRGRVPLPVGVSIPPGTEVLVGNNSMPTYKEDAGANKIVLDSGDMTQFAGKVYVSGYMDLNLVHAIGGTF